MADNNTPGVIVARRESPSVSHDAAVAFEVAQTGHLVVRDHVGTVAIYAPGEWANVILWRPATD